ncbi:MAG: ArsR family transcriptional regulator [Candidatus Methanoperedenaceae archaeon]|nr:MAG: ArsR family transcriptional regulator [Candidatus Methanoperedenaceae archaeon]
MSSIPVYGIIEDEIKSIFRSRLETQILLSLGEENKTLLQLREITGSTSQAVIPKIRILESNHLVEEDGYNYRLTLIGKILTSRIEECILTFGVYWKFKDFWTKHHLKGIPKPLLDDLGDLLGSEIIRDTTEDLHHVLSSYFRYLRESRQVFVVSSMTSPELIDAVIERLVQGIPVEVVITRDVFEKLDKEPYIEKCSEMMQFSNLKLMVTDEYVRVGTTVTEKFLSFGLYKKDGMLFDLTEEIFGFDNKSLDWGKRFFQYFKDRSVIVEIPKN